MTSAIIINLKLFNIPVCFRVFPNQIQMTKKELCSLLAIKNGFNQKRAMLLIKL